jgi:hypothetical protein
MARRRLRIGATILTVLAVVAVALVPVFLFVPVTIPAEPPPAARRLAVESQSGMLIHIQISTLMARPTRFGTLASSSAGRLGRTDRCGPSCLGLQRSVSSGSLMPRG